MKLTTPSLLALAGVASATLHLDLNLGGSHPHVHASNSKLGAENPHAWIVAGDGDARSPCPMLNTLANHGYIHRDGRNITREGLANGLIDSINFSQELAESMFDNVLAMDPTATNFDLDSLNAHNVGEHDASLSRADAYFGNNHVFNPNVFAQTRAYWTHPTVTAAMLANSKIARQLHSKTFNPTYTYTEKTEQTSYTETGFPILAFGNIEAGTVNRDFVKYWFENERLPSEVGWTVREEPVTPEQLAAVTQMIAEAVKLVTGGKKQQ
ncbi:peroxidase family protein [Aspergillus foveolatus]|uniref:peroxidase family protein n=1 Tax=Aspergillus foveolatus TaxID=210207 RepID=UPI003CCD7272